MCFNELRNQKYFHEDIKVLVFVLVGASVSKILYFCRYCSLRIQTEKFLVLNNNSNNKHTQNSQCQILTY